MTDAERDAPKYVQISDHYRRLILEGELAEGAQLPTTKELASQWRVATATVRQALSALQVEGIVRTSPRGTFVNNAPKVSSSGHDRLLRVMRSGRTLATGETKLVSDANLVVPPLYVAELFDLDPGDQVVRREFTTGRGQQRLMFGVNWYPAHFAALVPDLLSTAPKKGDDVLPQILKATGRTLKHGRDDMHGRDATEREANYLGCKTGTPILAGAHRWSDDQGILEYAEWCIPYRVVISYAYQFPEE